MPKIILHIGSGKTGTSALQVAFARNSGVLRREGVVYPESPSNGQARQGLVTSGNAMLMAKQLNPRLQYGGNPENFLRNFEKQMRESFDNNLLYSSEFLSYFQEKKLEELINIADRLGFSILIVFYIRSIAGHAYSVYSQAVKRGKYINKFSEFIQKYKNNFLEIIQKSERVVSRKNLVLRNFDNVRRDVFRDFVENVLGINYEASGFRETPKVNRSLDFFETEFVRCMNSWFKFDYQSVFTSDSLIYANPELPVRTIISQEEKEFFEQTYGETVNFINKYMNGEGINIFDNSIEIGNRPDIMLSEFERCLMSVLARLIPAEPHKHKTPDG